MRYYAPTAEQLLEGLFARHRGQTLLIRRKNGEPPRFAHLVTGLEDPWMQFSPDTETGGVIEGPQVGKWLVRKLEGGKPPKPPITESKVLTLTEQELCLRRYVPAQVIKDGEGIVFESLLAAVQINTLPDGGIVVAVGKGLQIAEVGDYLARPYDPIHGLYHGAFEIIPAESWEQYELFGIKRPDA